MFINFIGDLSLTFGFNTVTNEFNPSFEEITKRLLGSIDLFRNLLRNPDEFEPDNLDKIVNNMNTFSKSFVSFLRVIHYAKIKKKRDKKVKDDINDRFC